MNPASTLPKLLPRPKPTPEELRLWPDILRAVAVQLEAGIPPQQAFTGAINRISTPEGHEGEQAAGEKLSWIARRGYKRTLEDITTLLHALGSNAELGFALSMACRSWTERYRNRAAEHSRLRVAELGVCLRVSEATGAPLAASLTRAAEHAEESIDALLGRQSALAAPRATGRILSLLPFIGLGLGELMGTGPVGVLTASPVGICTGALGLALALAGKRWSAALVHQAEEGYEHG